MITKVTTYKKEQCEYQEIEVHRKTEEDLNFLVFFGLVEQNEGS